MSRPTAIRPSPLRRALDDMREQRDALQRRNTELANAEATLRRVATERDEARLHIVTQRDALAAAETRLKASELAQALARERADLLTLHYNALAAVATALARKVSP